MRIVMLALLSACSSPAPAPSAGAPPAPVAAAAGPTAGDESKPHTHDAPHGGMIKSVGDTHVEALMMPEGVMFYLSDADQRPIALDGYTGSATVNGPNGVQTVDLMSMGDHLHAPVTLLQGQPATAILTFTKDGRAQSASFETQAVGLQSHDHTPLHGGQVGMWGNHHLEYAPEGDAYRVWVTDAHRAAVTQGVSGSLKDGDTVVPLSLDPTTGMLSAVGAGAGTRPVMVDVTIGDASFSLGFNAALPAPGVGSMPMDHAKGTEKAPDQR